MKRIMFIGETGSGKRALIGSLLEKDLSNKRPMAIQYHGPFINTPGEFLENPWFYRALITTSVECETLAFVQSAARIASVFPPRFGSMFNRRVVGIVTDIVHENAHIARAERFLRNAGAPELIQVDVRQGLGMDELRMLAGSAV